MGKTRVSKSERNRIRKKASYKIGVETAERIRLLAEMITSQSALRTMLMQEQDVTRRKQLFDFMKPFLKFPNPEFPSTMDAPRIIIP